jgi:hypothetical protein
MLKGRRARESLSSYHIKPQYYIPGRTMEEGSFSFPLKSEMPLIRQIPARENS